MVPNSVSSVNYCQMVIWSGTRLWKNMWRIRMQHLLSVVTDSSVRIKYHTHQLTMTWDGLRLQTSEFLKQTQFKISGGFSSRMHELILRKDLFNCNWNFLFADGTLYVYQRRDVGHNMYFLMEAIVLFLQTTSMQDRRHQESQFYFTNVGLGEWPERYVCTIVWWQST